MSGWSRTTKPSADTTINAANIFGVDGAEIKVTNGPAHVGWVRVLDSAGGRKRYETLVAMKTPPTENNADDTVFPDTKITIATAPVAASANLLANANATAAFSVVATTSPTASLTYQWQRSTTVGGSTYAGVADGAVYSGNSTATLTVLAPTGLDGYKYRVVVAAPSTGASVTTTGVTLTVTE